MRILKEWDEIEGWGRRIESTVKSKHLNCICLFLSFVPLTFPSGMSGIERSGRALFTLFLKRSTNMTYEKRNRPTHTGTYCKTSRYHKRKSNRHNRTHTHTHLLMLMRDDVCREVSIFTTLKKQLAPHRNEMKEWRKYVWKQMEGKLEYLWKWVEKIKDKLSGKLEAALVNKISFLNNKI